MMNLDQVLDGLQERLGVPKAELSEMIQLLKNLGSKQAIVDYLESILGVSAFPFAIQVADHLIPDSIPDNPLNPPSNLPKTQKIWKHEENVYQKSERELVYMPKIEKKKVIQEAKIEMPPELIEEPAKPSKKYRKTKKYKILTPELIQRLRIVGNRGLTADGRPICECMAQIHPLLTNCLTCGRILCDIEGPGPCSTCQHYVESKEQQIQVFRRNNGKYEQGFKKAEEMQSRLVKYDREGAKRTHVHDIAADYEMVSRWDDAQTRIQKAKLSAAREALEKQPRRMVINLDLENQQVINVTPTIEDELKKIRIEDLGLEQPPAFDDSDALPSGLSIMKPPQEQLKSSGIYTNPFLKQQGPKYITS
jgi:hypothetical protein